MAEIAYKPIQQLTQDANTQIQKQNFLTGLLLNGHRKIITIEDLDSDQTVIYETPAGNTFFIVSACLTLRKTGGGDFRVGLGFNTLNSAENVFIMTAGTINVAGITPISMSFPIPLVMFYGENIMAIGASATDRITGSIVGYEIPTTFIPNFI